MSDAGFLTRVDIRNYKSIAACGVPLQPLTVLLGPSGAGKSNFLDAIRFVADALRTSLDHALRERGGIGEVRRRSGGHPTHFGMRLEFTLPGGSAGSYAFRIGAKPNGAFEVQNEECVLHPPEALAGEVRFAVTAGEVSSAVPGPPAASERLYLAAASDLAEFHPAYDALSRLEFYNLNPERIKDLQFPDAGELLAPDGRNISAVLDRIAKRRPEVKTKIEEYLSRIAPGICGVDAAVIGPRETLQFRQETPDAESPWRFFAANMSDGALRALGALVAIFQSGDAPLVGIEEPETGLHPAAAAILWEAHLEASAARQILVSSHSPDILDNPSLAPGAILAVVAEMGNTYAVPLDAVGRDALRKRLCTTGDFERLRPDRVPLEEVSSQQLDLIK
jgi:predicted ATPase